MNRYAVPSTSQHLPWPTQATVLLPTKAVGKAVTAPASSNLLGSNSKIDWNIITHLSLHGLGIRPDMLHLMCSPECVRLCCQMRLWAFFACDSILFLWHSRLTFQACGQDAFAFFKDVSYLVNAQCISCRKDYDHH